MIEYNRVELGKAAKERGFVRDTFEKVLRLKEILRYQVIAKLARLVRNLERKQGRIRAEHESWNEKRITGHFRRTLISYGLYESGKS